MATFLTLFNAVANLIWWIIILQFVMSWLINFNVINRHQPMVKQIWYMLNRITEPVYRPIRRMLPDMGGLDFSPLIVLFALYALQVVIHNNLAPLAYGG
jgi:YggT family protein